MPTHTNPIGSALLGASLALPFLIVNAIVGNQVEPFFSVIRPRLHTSGFEYVLLAVLLLCLPAGAFIALRPILVQRQERRPIHLLNGVLATVMLVFFVAVCIGLGSDIYRCDVLQIPNCD